MNIVVNRNTASQIKCLDLHLREITLSDYRGSTPEIDFAKFFVKNTRVLKAMRLGIRNRHSGRWWDTQHRRLRLKTSASTEAVFELGSLSVQFNCFEYDVVKHVIAHAMSVADLFALECLKTC